MSTTRKLVITLAGAALLAGGSLATAKGVRLEPRVMLSQGQLSRLQSVADDGADALRRYLWRTRMIYGWTWRDLVGED
jgi:hypothetical protein